MRRARCGRPVRGLRDDDLLALDRDRGMALDLEELRAIAAHFDDLGRDPTDVELETLAQTWSEHCSHKTFRARSLSTTGSDVTRSSGSCATRPRILSPHRSSAAPSSATPGSTPIPPGHDDRVKAETHNHHLGEASRSGAQHRCVVRRHPRRGWGMSPSGRHDRRALLRTRRRRTRPLPAAVLHPRLVAAGVVAGVADYGSKIGLADRRRRPSSHPGNTANPLVMRVHRRRAGSEDAELSRRTTRPRSSCSAAAPAATALRGATFSQRDDGRDDRRRPPARACRSAIRSPRSS
jgi:phosphoribosylformylglycinamidine synthase